MQTGQRGTQPVSPRDVTGTRARELLRQKAAREQVADNLAAVRRQAADEGYDAGFEAGGQCFIDSLFSLYRAEGFDAVRELLQELDEARGVAV
jgi:hypothetical protein